MSGNLGIYLHTPFCTRKCPYCHFYVIPDTPASHKVLVEAIALEWQRYALPSAKIDTLYFGGGTPILLGAKNIERLLSLFPPIEGEITIEANPETVTFALMKDLKSLGINRVSIGAQSFDDTLLKKIGRAHTTDAIKEAMHHTYNAGISNITLDLMYDLPGQTLEMWQETLRQAVALPITHFSLYNLTIEPNTLFAKRPPPQPPAEISEKMYRAAQEMLTERGFIQYEISAFAKSGYRAEHNRRYWMGKPFIGLGPSAFSYLEGRRFQNVPNLSKYARLLKNGESPIAFEEQLPYPRNVQELLAIHLRLLEGVDLESFVLPESTQQKLCQLKTLDLVEIEGSRCRLTQRGILLYDSVASELI